MTEQLEAWPAGQTWVFQGTVAEDGTGGTHVCTLTVTPGAGNEMQLSAGSIIVGATATAQTALATVDDGTNVLYRYVNATGTATGAIYFFPSAEVALTSASTGAISHVNGNSIPIISGTMRLVLQVTTAAISVTQTFAVVCRIKTGQKPTAVLADTVGTPSLTVNTNQVF